jgi:hypothetical protein
MFPANHNLQVPYMIFGEIICIIGTAFRTRLEPTTSTVAWAASLGKNRYWNGYGHAPSLHGGAIGLRAGSPRHFQGANTNGFFSHDDIPIGNGKSCLWSHWIILTVKGLLYSRGSLAGMAYKALRSRS